MIIKYKNLKTDLKMGYHIVIDEKYKGLLEKLMEESDTKTAKEFTEAMLTYFKDTGINPKEKTRSTAEELSKLRTTVISFIREQEKKKLDPIIFKVTEVVEFLKEYFQKEAVSKEDMENYIKQFKTQSEVKKPQIYNHIEDDERLQKFTVYVKSIFNEFAGKFKTSVMGGYTIDKAVFERYKSIFAKL